MFSEIFSKIVSGLVAIIASVGSLFAPAQPIPSISLQEITPPVVQNFGATIPTPIASFSTSLATKISSSDTSMTLVTTTTDDGTNLTNGKVYGFVLDANTASEEYVLGTVLSSNIVSMTRGISVITGNTNISALQKAHGRGASVKISDAPVLLVLARILNGDETVPNKLTYDSSVTISSFSNNQELISKGYADALTFAGAPNGSETQKGIYQTASTTNIGNGTALGDTGATLIVPNSRFNTTSSATTIVPVTKSNGKLSQGFLDLTEGFTFSGGVTSTGALVQSGTTTQSGAYTNTASSTFTNTLALATTTHTGNIILNSGTDIKASSSSVIGGMQLIYATTTDKAVADTTTEVIVSTTTIPANTLDLTNGIMVKVSFSVGTTGSGNGAGNVNLYYGGSRIGTMVASYSQVNSGGVNGTMSFFAKNSTSSQFGISDYIQILVNGGNINLGTGTNEYTTSVNSSIDQNLTIGVSRSGSTSMGTLTVNNIQIFKVLGRVF
jgi:hypothetical protein